VSSLDIICRDTEYWHTTYTCSCSDEDIGLIDSRHYSTIWSINSSNPLDRYLCAISGNREYRHSTLSVVSDDSCLYSEIGTLSYEYRRSMQERPSCERELASIARINTGDETILHSHPICERDLSARERSIIREIGICRDHEWR
jgi:hypothetical protein